MPLLTGFSIGLEGRIVTSISRPEGVDWDLKVQTDCKIKLAGIGVDNMVDPEMLKLLDSEWIYSKSDSLMESLEENYGVKPEAPDEIKRQFDELCKLMKEYG